MPGPARTKCEHRETSRLADFLLMLLDTADRLERILFDCFRTRLALDIEPGDMRSRFGHVKRKARVSMTPKRAIVKYF